MVQIGMSEDFTKELIFELGLILGFSLVLAEVVDVEETKYGSYQKVLKDHMFGKKMMVRKDDK